MLKRRSDRKRDPIGRFADEGQLERQSCSIEDCANEAVRLQRTLCEMHYYRQRRNGHFGRRARSRCIVEGCESYVRSSGLCQKHHKRMQVHGSLDLPIKETAQCANPECARMSESKGYCKRCWERVKKHADPNFVKRANWTGDDASYRAVHNRLRTERGRAAGYLCKCGRNARQWAYLGGAPDERRSKEGPYTPDLGFYEAMCIPCHKRMDLARIKGVSA